MNILHRFPKGFSSVLLDRCTGPDITKCGADSAGKGQEKLGFNSWCPGKEELSGKCGRKLVDLGDSEDLPLPKAPVLAVYILDAGGIRSTEVKCRGQMAPRSTSILVSTPFVASVYGECFNRSMFGAAFGAWNVTYATLPRQTDRSEFFQESFH